MSTVNNLIEEILALRTDLNKYKTEIGRKALEIDSIGDRMTELSSHDDQYIKARDKRRRLREEIIELNQNCLDVEAMIEQKQNLIEFGDIK